jgi:hypothetical protein
VTTGKWAQAGVPHKGWVCQDIEDAGAPGLSAQDTRRGAADRGRARLPHLAITTREASNKRLYPEGNVK